LRMPPRMVVVTVMHCNISIPPVIAALVYFQSCSVTRRRLKVWNRCCECA